MNRIDEIRTQRSEKRTQKSRILLTSLFSFLTSAFSGISIVFLLVTAAARAAASNEERMNVKGEGRNSGFLPSPFSLLPSFDDGIGRVDTVGGTTWDRQVVGAEPRTICCDTAAGVAVGWNFSALPGGGNPDLNVRFNFFDRTRMTWTWIDSASFMNSGVNVFTRACLIGNLDVNPVTHCAYIGATRDDGRPALARESLPGSRGFRESDGPQNYLRPLISTGRQDRVHVALKDASLGTSFYYSGIDTGLAWSNPFLIPPPLPEPGQANYVIAASRQSPRISILWLERNRIPPCLRRAQSTDDGLTWPVADTIGLPPAFHPRSETLPCPVDVFPWYDPDEDEDALHIVVSVVPILSDTTIVSPAEIWHWSEAHGWTRIASAGCDPAHLQGSLGLDAIYAGRPTLGVDPLRHELICAWEQFDSTNVEPLSGKLRADVWACRGDSTGTRWGAPVRLTDPDNTSKRFPCIADFTGGDTAAISYLIDSVAGFGGLGQGPWTNNPIVVRWVPIGLLPQSGVTEDPPAGTRCRIVSPSMRLSASPNPFRNSVTITGTRCRIVSLSSPEFRIFDRSGRLVRSFHVERGHDSASCPHPPSYSSVTWNGTDESGQELPNGVYLVCLEGENHETQTEQVILLR